MLSQTSDRIWGNLHIQLRFIVEEAVSLSLLSSSASGLRQSSVAVNV